MLPQLRSQPKCLKFCTSNAHYPSCQHRYTSLATATTPAPPIHQRNHAAQPTLRYPPTQPPSYKPPEFRKSQLHRQYTSLLRSSPLMLIFQHNNLKAVEWMGIRRELAKVLMKVDGERAKSGHEDLVGDSMKIQIVQTGIFASALRVVEFWDPNLQSKSPTAQPSESRQASSASVEHNSPDANDPAFTHGLSAQAHTEAKRDIRLKHGLEPLLSGPLVLLTMPSVSPQYLKAALSILAPSPGFPAPKRRANPGLYETSVQSGLQKLLLLGARVESKVFDMEGARWVGSIEDGIDGLRMQLVAVLRGIGSGITNTLEAAGRSLYVTVDGRRGMLEEEQKDSSETKA